MPSIYQQALDALRTSTNRPVPNSRLLPEELFDMGGSTANAPAINHAFRDSFGDELQDRAFQAARTGDTGEVGALKGLFDYNEATQAASPIQHDINSRNKGFASIDGLGESAVESLYNRNQAEQKMQIPLREAHIRNEGDVNVAGIQGRNQLLNTEALGRNQLAVADRNNENAAMNLQRSSEFIQGLMRQLDPTGQSGSAVLGKFLSGGSINPKTGSASISIGQERPTPPAPQILSRDVLATKSALDKVAGSDWTWGPFGENAATTQARNAHQQAQSSLISRWPAGNHIKEAVQEVLSTPELEKLSPQDIMHQFEDFNQWTPQDVKEFNDLMLAVRGTQGLQ